MKLEPVLHVAFCTCLIYLYLIVMLRITGRRELSQLTTVDLLLIVLLGSAVETSMVGASTLLRYGFVSGTTLFATNMALTYVFRRFPKVRRACGGQPILIVHDGQILENRCRKLGLSDDMIMEALREREVCNLEDVRFAVFEPDGEINVIQCDRKVHTTQLPASTAS